MKTPTLQQARRFFEIDLIEWQSMPFDKKNSYVNEILERYPNTWRAIVQQHEILDGGK